MFPATPVLFFYTPFIRAARQLHVTEHLEQAIFLMEKIVIVWKHIIYLFFIAQR